MVVKSAHEDIVKLLIKLDADINISGNTGTTVLMYAYLIIIKI